MANTEYEFEVRIKRNGQPFAGFDPFRCRLSVAEEQPIGHQVADSAGFVSLLNHLDSARFFFATADQALTHRFDGQSDAGLVMDAQGLILLIGCTIDSAAATLATASNASGSAAKVTGAAGGS